MIDTSVTLHQLNTGSLTNMGHHLGVEFVDIQPQALVARMPVDHRTMQPLGLLNGGASAALAEMVGSLAGYLCLDREQFYCLGLEIKCNHVRAVPSGYVTATATPIHIGTKTHVWKIEITNENGALVCFATHTLAILPVTEGMRENLKVLLGEGFI